MKKILALVFVFVIVLASAGCTKTPPAVSTDVVSTEVTSTSETSVEKVVDCKIGFAYAPESDILSGQFHRALNFASKTVGCEMLYYDLAGWDTESIATAYETLVQQGATGIIDVMGMSSSTMAMLNEKGVYYVAGAGNYNDETAAIVKDSQYSVGFAIDSGETTINFDLGHGMMQKLAESGAKNVAYLGLPPGWAVSDEVTRGAEAGVKDYNLNLITTYLGYDFGTGTSDMIATYGEKIDGIAILGSAGDTVVAAIMASGYQDKIKLVTGDVPSDAKKLMDDGFLVGVASGNYAQVYFMFMQVYNAVSGGDRLFNTDKKFFPIPGFLMFTDSEELTLGDKYIFVDNLAFSADELKALTSTYNPGASVAEKEALFTTYTTPEFFNIQSIAERFSGN